MDNTCAVVKKTRDYTKFRILKGNRLVARARVEKIIASIQDVGYVMNPIIVNERMEVIDGQGRLEALTELQLPVYYLVVPNAGIRECVAMNINQMQWNTMDYIRSYAERGDENYKVLWEAVERFSPGVPLLIIISVCSNNLAFYNAKDLKAGKFEVKRWDWESVLIYLSKYVPYKGLVGGSWSCLMKVLQRVYDSKEVDRNIMYEQFKKYGRVNIGSISTTEDALDVLETVYNYRKHGHTYLKQPYDEAVKERNSAGIAHRKKRI